MIVEPLSWDSEFFNMRSGYENLLLFSRRLQVVGRQHGGGYDMFSDDYFGDFEKKLCDQFIGWGMSSIKERQRRFFAGDSPSVSDSGKKRLIWIEQPRLPLIMLPISPSSGAQVNKKSVVRYIHEEILSAERQFFSLAYPGQLRSPDYAGMRGEELISKTGKGETMIGTNDVVIFDISAATLTLYYIDQGIIFLVVIVRDNIAQLTDGAKDWVDILRSSGFSFFDDEVGLLSRRLGEVLSDKFELPATVKRYHREKFIDLLPAGSL